MGLNQWDLRHKNWILALHVWCSVQGQQNMASFWFQTCWSTSLNESMEAKWPLSICKPKSCYVMFMIPSGKLTIPLDCTCMEWKNPLPVWNGKTNVISYTAHLGKRGKKPLNVGAMLHPSISYKTMVIPLYTAAFFFGIISPKIGISII